MGKSSTKGVVAQVNNLGANVFINFLLIHFLFGDFVNVHQELIVVVRVAIILDVLDIVAKTRPYRQRLPTATMPFEVHFRAHMHDLKAELILQRLLAFRIAEPELLLEVIAQFIEWLDWPCAKHLTELRPLRVASGTNAPFTSALVAWAPAFQTRFAYFLCPIFLRCLRIQYKQINALVYMHTWGCARSLPRAF